MFEKRYTLLRTQKKRAYEILREAGLEPAEFSWAKVKIAGSLIVSRLEHRGGEHYFQFSCYELNAWCLACPGQFRSMDYSYPKTWDEQERLLAQWARTLRQELDVADPWAKMEKFRLTFDGDTVTTSVNEPISGIEVDEIGRTLKRLTERLTHELELDGEQERMVRQQCEYLAEGARRQRGRDWAFTTVGVCTTMAMALAPTDEKLRTLWEIVRSELQGFVRLKPVHNLAAARGGRILGVRLRKPGADVVQPQEREILGESPDGRDE